MKKTVVLGIGNMLLSDEGVGVHVVHRLQEMKSLLGKAELIDGATAGLGLLHSLEDVDRLIIIDAVETGGPPGTIIRLVDDEAPAYMALKISPHEITLPDCLAAAKLRGHYPKEVIVWGIQPESLDVGIQLSPVVSEKLDQLVHHVMEETRA